MLMNKGKTLPGWRDFERAVAVALDGIGPENKGVFDVFVTNPKVQGRIGLSCKMKEELNRIDKDGRVYLELNNANKAFRSHLAELGILELEYRSRAAEVGPELIRVIEQIRGREAKAAKNSIALESSYYLVLLWSKSNKYQIYQFPLKIPDVSTVRWHSGPDDRSPRKCIVGEETREGQKATLFEWYYNAGQFKYYPHRERSVWRSEVFGLEALPATVETENVIRLKTIKYFPDAWSVASSP